MSVPYYFAFLAAVCFGVRAFFGICRVIDDCKRAASAARTRPYDRERKQAS